MTIVEHWVAHTRRGWDRVVEHASASWLWGRLRSLAPNAFAVALLPDHLWSTARDLVGAVAPVWVDVARVARVLRHSPREAIVEVLTTDAERARAALSAEVPARGPVRAAIVPVRHDATPCLSVWSRPIVTLTDVAHATASALRAEPRAVTCRTPPARAVFVALAERHGTPRTMDLAAACEVGTRTIRALRGRAPDAAVAAAERCLLDPRLRRWCA